MEVDQPIEECTTSIFMFSPLKPAGSSISSNLARQRQPVKVNCCRAAGWELHHLMHIYPNTQKHQHQH